MGNIRCGRGVSVVFIATHYSALRSTFRACVVRRCKKKSQPTSLMATNQKKQRKCRLIAKLYTYTRLGFPRGVRSWKWPSCAVIFGGRDTVLLRSFASSSLDLFAGRCGVVACRFRSLSISPSLSYSIAVIVNRSLLSPRASAVYTRTYAYVRLRTARGITQTRGVRRNALAMKTTLMPHLRICP